MTDLVCNICGCSEFLDKGSRKKVMCENCRSLERTRLLFFFLEKLDISSDSRFLHIAPERGIYKYLKNKVSPGNYTCADYTPDRYKFAPDCQRIDLCDLGDWRSDEYDYILHSHVLEHTFCNVAYSIYHLHRMLKPTGRHVFLVPIRAGRFREDFNDIPDQERAEKFGQADHSRHYGRNDLGMHLGAILRLPSKFDATQHVGPEQLRRANIPEKFWSGLTGNTVFNLAKQDYLLGHFA